MSESYDFPNARAVVPGAIGEPGRRTFFLQVHTDTDIVSFKVEKQQVAALCEYFEGILDDLSDAGEPPLPAILAVEPLDLQWTVGGLGVAWDEDEDRLLVVAEELVLDDDDDDEEREPATARVHLSPAQIAAFVLVGDDLVRSGRPACRLCGRPIDIDGHACPRLN